MAARKPASSSSSAGMIVSGTYWPPYGPNRPRATGGELVGAMVIATHGLHKGSDQTRILAASGEFNAAADVHPKRHERIQRACDVVRTQPAGSQAARPHGPECAPVE